MKTNEMPMFPQKEIDNLCEGDASAREMFMKIATGNQIDMILGCMLLDVLRNKRMNGYLIGKIWTDCENNLMFTIKFVETMPPTLVFLMNRINLPVEIERKVDAKFIEIVDKIKLMGKEQGWYTA